MGRLLGRDRFWWQQSEADLRELWHRDLCELYARKPDQANQADNRLERSGDGGCVIRLELDTGAFGCITH